MPQDDLEEVKEALLAARAADGSENPVFYSKFVLDLLPVILHVYLSIFSSPGSDLT